MSKMIFFIRLCFGCKGEEIDFVWLKKWVNKNNIGWCYRINVN